ncbi:hypothetical protein ACQ4LE_006307 [Meloidogyne hapla]
MGSVENESPRKRKKPSSDEHDSSLTDDSDDANKFITVLGPNENEPMNIQLSKDGTLPLPWLDHAFPGAYGLKYKNPKTGKKCAVPFDDWKNAFLEPSGGWAKREYLLIFQPKLPPAASAVSETTNSRFVSPYPKTQGDLPSFDSIEKYLFYIPNLASETRDCATCVSPFYFATFRHGSHLLYKEGGHVDVYSDKDHIKFDAVVKFINEEKDFILLKSSRKIVENGPGFCIFACQAQTLLSSGYGIEYEHRDIVRTIAHKKGCSSFVGHAKYGSKFYGPFTFGTIPVTGGDSGGPVWDSHGLYGLNLGKILFKHEPNADNVDRAANHIIKNYMVIATDILYSLKLVEARDSPRTNGRPEFLGMGDVEMEVV